MYRVSGEVKRDPVRRWALPDRVFFACGACHILAHVFISQARQDFRPIWIKPLPGYTGNHIVAVCGTQAFDYHGHSHWPELLRHMKAKANRWWPGWDCELIELPIDVLISESKSREYDGLWLREPRQFLHDARPRAELFIQRFSGKAAVL